MTQFNEIICVGVVSDTGTRLIQGVSVLRRVEKDDMCCRGFWECILKLLNFILTVAGLAMVGYGIYLLVGFTKTSDDDTPEISPVSDDSALIQLGRPMLMAVSLSDTIFAKLPNAWYAYFPFPVIFGAYHRISLAQGYIDVGKTVFSSEGLG
ncbi:GMFP4 [Trifolium medium]|uniref:GMFP4 n=1 Tax=Trifolium medium TaxID=97028 RepID=A0A392N412_9FABA|nr:GMFP4 [Trifolium medium]